MLPEARVQGTELVQSGAASPHLSTTVSAYVRSSVSNNTRRAYRSDVADFLCWGGAVPATPERIAQYLADRAAVLSPYTLARRLVALAQAHRVVGSTNPCGSELVRATMRGIRRVRGLAQRRVDPLLREDLLAVIELMPDSIMGMRNRALLLVGFAGAFRRSELAAMQVEDIRFVPEGLVASLPRSKTDQEGAGRTVAIPWARSKACAVRALKAWIEHARLNDGPVFRGLGKNGQVSVHGISGASVALLSKSMSRGSDLMRRDSLVIACARVGYFGGEVWREQLEDSPADRS